MHLRRSRVGIVISVLLAFCTVACSPDTSAATSAKTVRKTVKPSVKKTVKPSVRPVTTTTRVVAVVEPSQVAAVRARQPFQEFDEVRFTITAADGTPREFCALLADTDARRQQGLMGRTELAGYDAMLFSWPQDTTSAFWMRTVPIWLSIAWFDVGGRHVGQVDMAPCGDRDDCPRYGAPAAYRWAMETMRDGLTPLGVRDGVTLRVGGRCAAREPS